jgi:hypothetical protein
LRWIWQLVNKVLVISLFLHLKAVLWIRIRMNPHQIERQDPDPDQHTHQSDKLDPDPH